MHGGYRKDGSTSGSRAGKRVGAHSLGVLVARYGEIEVWCGGGSASQAGNVGSHLALC